MNIKLTIAHFIRWHELKLAWKVWRREYILQHNLFGHKWKNFNTAFGNQSLEVLLKNLDEESVSTVHLLLDRFANTFAVYPSLYPKEIFSQHELVEQNTFNAIKHSLSRKYDIPVSEVDPSPMLYQSGLYFVPKRQKKEIENTAVLDIGAFIGQASVSFLDLHPRTIYSFEPVAENFKKLSKSLREPIEAKKIVPVNCAMGEKRGFVYMNDNGNTSSVTDSSEQLGAQKVDVTTVDDFVYENGIAKVGLIKLDVEGFEMNVMKGSLETIKRDKPILLLSIYHTPNDFFKIKPIIEDMNLGYRFIVRKINPFWLTYDTMLICYVE